MNNGLNHLFTITRKGAKCARKSDLNLRGMKLKLHAAGENTLTHCSKKQFEV